MSAANEGPLAVLAANEEAPSTSCSEESPLVHEPPKSARNVPKIAAAAILTALIVAAGTSWALNGSISEKTTSLAGETVVYHAHATIGCSNWAQASTRVANVDKAACAAACTADASCVGFDWQEAACAGGFEGVPDPPACLLFKEACVAERNECWEMNYKSTSTITVSQTLTVDAEGPEEDIRAGVEAALTASGVEATVTPAPAPAGVRRLAPGRRLGFFSFLATVVSAVEETADKAYEFFVGLAEDPDVNKAFTSTLKASCGATVTITGDSVKALPPTVEKTGEEERPDPCATESQDCRAAACCKQPGLFCYEKDAYWAGCRPSCTVGIHEFDPPAHKTPWSCAVLDSSADAPPPIPAPTTTEAEAAADANETEAATTAPPPACAEQGADCLEAVLGRAPCCKEPGNWCYKKSEYYASCRPNCNIGIYEYDDPNQATPWTCDPIDVDKENQPEPTLEATTS